MTTAAADPLRLTSHPLQRCGAWSVAVLAGRTSPREVSAADVDGVVALLVEDVCAAASADKERDKAAYDWWKVLLSLYPNSKATHSKRPKDPAVLEPAIAELFRPDDVGGGRVWPCVFCGASAGVAWTKMLLPMFDSDKAVNTLPPGVSGWPVCRGCRVAMWALPYGAWVTAGSATVLTCEEPAAERAFVARNVRRARQVMQVGFDGLPATARPERVVAEALRRLGPDLPSAAVLWSFRNDNQEPWLRVTHTRRGTARLLSVVDGQGPLRAGWHLLVKALTMRDKAGHIIRDGRHEVPRLLFEAEDGRSRSLLSQVFQSLADQDRSWSPYGRQVLARLGVTYAKEMFGMEPKLDAVAALLADWIAHGSSSSRGKFAQYRAVALKPFQLGQLLMQAQARLLLDGRAAPAGPKECEPVLTRRSRGWETRMLLFFAVTELLAQRGVALGEKADGEHEERIEQLVEQPILAPDEIEDEGGEDAA
ncbi:hypothetical protein GCM10027168_44790 [Streptomyces capparidis]